MTRHPYPATYVLMLLSVKGISLLNSHRIIDRLYFIHDFFILDRCTENRSAAFRSGLSDIESILLNKIGTNAFWYRVTEVLGIFPSMIVGYFALPGLLQLYARKKLSLVDKKILALGFLYAAVAACYVLFEKAVINYIDRF